MLDITITYNGLTVFRSHCLVASRQSLGHHYDTFGMVHMDIDRFIHISLLVVETQPARDKTNIYIIIQLLC
jgi:hypothetical protein